MADGHAVYLLGCEQNMADISEPCAKPTVAVACERATAAAKNLSFAPHRMCSGHAWMHAKDPVMEVTWLIEIEGA